VSTRHGADLAAVDFARVFERAGRTGYVLHRAALHTALAARVAPEAIRTGARVARIEDDGAVARAVLEDGTAIEGDLLVGADGLHSAVRRHVLGDGAPRYAGETLFRGIADASLAEPDLCRELFGDGRRTAHYDLGGGQTYWWASAPLPADAVVPPGERRAFLARAFAGWAFGVTELFARTPEERILQNGSYDRAPVRRWHRGACVLLGDAAHPTTPNLGQGACMAIEDAVVLARSLVRADTLPSAFAAFHAERASRCARTIRLSRLWGDVGLWRHPLATAARDAAFRLTGFGFLERSALDQYVYDPGPLEAGTVRNKLVN
jgi:2-polyprenyl-6-methoxyphenol hydroxylase-like FAD-dependent oxidoreductase